MATLQTEQRTLRLMVWGGSPCLSAILTWVDEGLLCIGGRTQDILPHPPLQNWDPAILLGTGGGVRLTAPLPAGVGWKMRSSGLHHWCGSFRCLPPSPRSLPDFSVQ